MIKIRINRTSYFATTLMVLAFVSASCAQNTHDVSKENGHGHHDEVMKNGEKAMGFSQTKTRHNFLLMPDGGAIRVEVIDAADSENRDKVRNHLKEIVAQFSKGNFKTPFAVHSKMPPGVGVMDELKGEIEYRFEERENGAQVRISTKNAKALAAVHEFLRFQIEDHQTGDPTTIEN
jgi:hypothetical protein